MTRRLKPAYEQLGSDSLKGSLEVNCVTFLHFEVDVAEPCMDEGIVCEVKGFVSSELDEESEETAELMPPPSLRSLTAVDYITSLKQLVRSKALGDEYFAALNNLETTIIGSALVQHEGKQAYQLLWETMTVSAILFHILHCPLVMNTWL